MSQQIQQHILDQYKIIQKIGSGAYGIVWKVKQHSTGKTFALKKNFDAFANSTDAQRTYRQIMFLRQLNSPYIIKLNTVHRAYNDKDIYLVFEFVDVDLYTLSRDQSILSGQHKKYILYQVAKSLLYLHTCRIIHRDLKPSNILVNQNCQIKLCDFGLVRSLEENNSFQNTAMTDYIATRWYRAPQILFSIPHYQQAIDIWSFGCLMGQVMKGKAIFPGTSTHNQLQKIMAWTGMPTNKELKQIQQYISKQTVLLFKPKALINKKEFVPCQDKYFHKLMQRTLSFSAADRPSIEQILEDSYFAEFYESDIEQIEMMKKERKRITVPVDDNKRLTVNQYRQLIYCEISANYRNKKELEQQKTIKRKKSTKKNSTPIIETSVQHKNSQTINNPLSVVNCYKTSEGSLSKENQPALSKDQDTKVRKTKIYSADPSFKASRSNSVKKQMNSTNAFSQSNKKRKGISIISTKLKTEGHIETQPAIIDCKGSNSGITSYANKLIKAKKQMVSNSVTKNKQKFETQHPMKKCIEETGTKKIRRAVNINFNQKCYTQFCEKKYK